MSAVMARCKLRRCIGFVGPTDVAIAGGKESNAGKLTGGASSGREPIRLSRYPPPPSLQRAIGRRARRQRLEIPVHDRHESPPPDTVSVRWNLPEVFYIHLCVFQRPQPQHKLA